MKLVNTNANPAVRAAQRGFTLVEMLLVLVILGILAAIVYPKVAGRGEEARKSAAAVQIAAFSTALDTFEVDTGSYPKGANGLNELVSPSTGVQGWKGPYLKEIPLDPWQHPYIYECPGRHNPTSFDLYSAGPDGRDGTDDDITNWKR